MKFSGLFVGAAPRQICAGCFPLLSALLIGSSAISQETGSLPNAPQDQIDAFRKNVTLLGIPPATVAPDGLVFASLSLTNKRNGIYDDADGSAAVGFGLGLGDGAVDLQFTANITSLEDNFGDSGYFSIKASRRVDSGGTPTYIGVIADYLGTWGDSSVRDPGFAAAVTAFPVVNISGDAYPLMLTLGGGTDVSDFETEPGAFAGIGIGLTEHFGTSAAWNGDNVDIGASFRFPDLENWGFTATLDDAFDMDDRRRVTVSVNWISDKLF